MLPAYLLQLVIPLVAWSLVRKRFRQYAEFVALGTDLAFAACLSAQLFAPETNSSGSVVFLSLKMMTTAVLFPWRAGLQYLSATVTVLMYYLCLVLSHRSSYDALYLYHYFGLPEAALLSMIGARFADRARRELFRQGAERQWLLEDLQAANRLKSDFVATMSHELRTPLHIILGYQSLLQEGRFGPQSPDQSAVTERIGQSGRELLELISATLDVSRIDSGSVKIAKQRVQLHKIASQVDVETRELQTKPNVRVEWHIEPSLPPVDTDPAKFKVILKNLFSNALKFTEVGSVVVSAAEQDGGVEVRVTDTGIGISREALPIIFEPFRQVAEATTRRHGGVGLGLYIVHRLVGMLGAKVHVESEPGRGTCFRVWLPLASSDGAPV